MRVYLIHTHKHTKTQKEIAQMLGVHPSTISRELKRGQGKICKDYWPIASDNRAIKMQSEKSKNANLKLTPKTIDLIVKYLLMGYLPEQIAANKIKRLLYPFKNKVHTITTDNGLEFAKHKSVTKALKCDFYFCDPYSSWQRGLNENINGLIRQYIPKGSSLENITKKQIKHIEERLNHRPRKSIGWKTPYEVFHKKEAV